ncbi:MAG: hypothetical protein LBQ31_11470 [Bacteroidales bacterium]|nr:hypothetical protein [Bacteroidales bacterium]
MALQLWRSPAPSQSLGRGRAIRCNLFANAPQSTDTDKSPQPHHKQQISKKDFRCYP